MRPLYRAASNRQAFVILMEPTFEDFQNCTNVRLLKKY